MLICEAAGAHSLQMELRFLRRLPGLYLGFRVLGFRVLGFRF